MEELSILDMGRGLREGALSAQELVAAYLARIAALDTAPEAGGPHLGALIELNPEAETIARALDEERRAGRVRGALHGIPVVLKDNIDTADHMQTTAGSLALEGPAPPRDSAVARRLREAGVVILGKANLSEWANFRASRSISGRSSRGGQTRNPYALDRSPSGSSSGSAVAVAANLTAVAVGTETDGSIVSPSSACSIVGIKPTVGLISRAGIIPIAHSQDTAGPMGRTVADAAILLGALVGVDAEDAATAENRGRAAPDYAAFLDPDGLRVARIGVARNLFPRHERVTQLLEDALEAMRGLGAEIIDPADLTTQGTWRDAEREVLRYEFKADLNAYLARRGPGAPMHSLAEIIAYNQAHGDRVMPYYGQDVLVEAQAKGPLTDVAYLEALAMCRRLSREEGIDATLAAHRLDALVAPTSGPPWLIDCVNGDSGLGGCSSPAAVAGYPHITVPMGYVWGLPVGLSFFGAAYSEPMLIRLAYAYERATQVRRPPRFLPTAETMAQASRRTP